VEDYVQGQMVALTATPEAMSVFSQWSGACSGSNPMITVTMDAARSCTATFDAAP